jgi:DNA polymerase elongation subunit (family B)
MTNNDISYISALLKGKKTLVWERLNPDTRVVKTYDTLYYFFYDDPDGEYTTIYGNKVSKIGFDSYKEMKATKEEMLSLGINVWESDVKPDFKTLSENYYGKTTPNLNICLYDIEVDYDPEIGFSSIDNPYAPINAVSLYNDWEKKAYIVAVPPESWKDVDIDLDDFSQKLNEIAEIDINFELIFLPTEADLLKKCLKLIENSDIISGWNSEFFDDPYVGKRIELVLGNAWFKKLSFTEANPPEWSTTEKFDEEQTVIKFGGRVNIDYLALFRKFSFGDRPSYSLDNIAEEVLPDMKKIEYDGSLAQLYNEDFIRFIRYNLRDSEILKGFEDTLGYISLAVEMSHSATCNIPEVLGTIKISEYAIINTCRYELGGLIVPDNKPPPKDDERIEGAYVLPPKVGFHKNIASVDVTSLYPSAIRSCNVSPEVIVGQFENTQDDFQELVKRSDKKIVFIIEETGEKLTLSAKEWREIFKKRNWCYSGYGTVFTMNKKGFIPKVLEIWFNKRVKFKNLSKKHYQDAEKTTDEAEKSRLLGLSAYYDRVQMVFKLSLNSLYGAYCNKYFKFYDLRLGFSTTATGKAVLRHQCAKSNELLGGSYDVLGEHIIYGDTDSTYFLTNAENIDEATRIGDLVGEQCNESFPAFMEDTFGCVGEFKDFIKTDREVIGTSGIFLAKKMYLIHIINLEGKKVDKMKIMGVQLKKTNIPPEFQNFFKDVVEDLLKGGDWDEISERVMDFKNDLYTSPDVKRLGLPKGIKKVKHYTEEFYKDVEVIRKKKEEESQFVNQFFEVVNSDEIDDEDFSEVKTRLPGHVAASIHWNYCLKKYNDLESTEIKTGDKIKVFYLKHNFYGKFKSIAIPSDQKTLPEWFNETYKGEIDKDAQWYRLAIRPMVDILGVLNLTFYNELTFDKYEDDE